MEALMKQLLEMASDIQTEVKKSVAVNKSDIKNLVAAFECLNAAAVQVEDEMKSMGKEVNENLEDECDGFNNIEEEFQRLESGESEMAVFSKEVSGPDCTPISNIEVATSCQVYEARFDMIAEENDWDSVDISQHLAGSLRAEAEDVLTTIAEDRRISCGTEKQASPKDRYSVGSVAGQKDTEVMLEVVAGIAGKLKNIENAKKDGMIENSRGKDGTHETTGCATSRMLLGRELNLPCDVIFGQSPNAFSSPVNYIRDLQERLEDVRDFDRRRIDIKTGKMKSRSDARATEHEFHGGGKVRSWKYRRKGLLPKLSD